MVEDQATAGLRTASTVAAIDWVSVRSAALAAARRLVRVPAIAEEIAQDATERTVRAVRAARDEPIESAVAYATTTATNLAKNYLSRIGSKERGNVPVAATDDFDVEGPSRPVEDNSGRDPADRVVETGLAIAVFRRLFDAGGLTHEQRRLVILLDVLGTPLDEVGLQLGLGEGELRVRRHEAEVRMLIGAGLTPTAAEAVVLRRLRGLKNAAAAAVVGCTPNTFAQRYRYGIAALLHWWDSLREEWS